MKSESGEDIGLSLSAVRDVNNHQVNIVTFNITIPVLQ
jgi:hypothetical protein